MELDWRGRVILGKLAEGCTKRAKIMPIVRANFDANFPEKEQAQDFDIIISKSSQKE